MPENQLESIYAEARQALKAKNHKRAADLLKQILVLDENYKDASRLLAQLVREKRRRWYNDLRLWGPVFGIIIVGLLVWGVSKLPWQRPITPPAVTAGPTETTFPTLTAAPTIQPTQTTPPTATALPTPTPIPLAWKRISLGQEFPRNTVTAIVFDPKNADVIYISTHSAGIYKSLDGGLSWQPIQRGLNRAAILSLRIDPLNPEVLFAGASLGGVYKTLDGGQNWFPINNGIDVTGGRENISQVANDPQDSDKLYYINGYGFYRSLDSGESWTRLQSDQSLDIHSILVNPFNPAELLRTEFFENKYPAFKSLDAGNTWKQTDMSAYLVSYWAGRAWNLVAHPLIPGKVTAYASGKSLHSDDFGDHWERSLSNKSKSNGCSTMIAFDPVDGTKAYCVGGGWECAPPKHAEGVVKPDCVTYSDVFQFSNDDGQNWQRLGQLDLPIEVLAVSPADNSRILAGKEGLRASTDGGLSWQPVENGLGAKSMNFLFNFDSSGLLSLALMRGDFSCPSCKTQLFISGDKGKSWEPWVSGSTFSTGAGGFFWTKPWTDGMYTFTDPGEGYVSKGPGDPPRKIRLPQNNLLLYPDAFIPNRLFAATDCADTSALYLSQNGGLTWKASNMVNHIICEAQFNFVDSNPDLIYLTNAHSVNSTESSLYRSEDGGLSWEACERKANWYSMGRSGRLAVDPSAPQHILLATRGEGVLVSTNGCRNWQASNTGLGSLYVNAMVIDPKKPDTVYAGTDGGAYISTDGGQTWGQVNEGLLGATVVYSIMVDQDSNVYAATPYGVFKLENR